MSTPTERAGTRPLLLCAIGLLLTVADVNGFGFDFANDTVGYALVAAGSVSARPTWTSWWSALAVTSAVAAAVGLFTYGGVVSKLVSGSYFLWESMFYAVILLGGAVVALLALALRTTVRDRHREVALLLLAVTTVVLTGVRLLMRLFEIGVYGPTNYLLQLVVVMNGLLALALLVLVFLVVTDTGDA